jgi:saccharopine dehydrogenase-like NADP-dependent oxidoreductase
MKRKVLVFGGGVVGEAAAKNLCDEFDVTVVDASSESLSKFKDTNITVKKSDCFTAVDDHINDGDSTIFVNALPGKVGYAATALALCHKQKRIVDVSFYEKDPFTKYNGESLHDIANKNKAICLVDFGFSPGLSNLILGDALRRYHKLNSYWCLVAGLPADDRSLWNYKATWSPEDVIQEYLRPARYIENGEVVTRDPLSHVHNVSMPGVKQGLEFFYSDGTRTMLRYRDRVPYISEMTGRYRGHLDKIRLLKESGFFNSNRVVEEFVEEPPPLEFTTEILKDAWHMESDEPDISTMRVALNGYLNESDEGDTVEHVELFDKYDKESGLSSMARITGFTAAAGVRMLDRHPHLSTGVYAPEDVGQSSEYYKLILDDLARFNINLKHSFVV